LKFEVSNYLFKFTFLFAFMILSRTVFSVDYPSTYENMEWRLHSLYEYGGIIGDKTVSEAYEKCEARKSERLSRYPSQIYECIKQKGKRVSLFYALTSCPVGFTWSVDEKKCKLPVELFCPIPYQLSSDGSICEARCLIGEEWDGSNCIAPQFERTECTQTPDPIDIHTGEKVFVESIITTSSPFPIKINLLYTSKAGKVSKQGTSLLVKGHDRFTYVADTTPVGSASGVGVISNNGSLPSPSYIDLNWRHNYQDYLKIEDDELKLYLSNGLEISFDTVGQTVFGYKVSLKDGVYILSHVGSDVFKEFDAGGRLVRVSNLHGLYHELIYEDGLLVRIDHSLGESVEISYTKHDFQFSVYSDDSIVYLPSSFMTDYGLNAIINWSELGLSSLGATANVSDINVYQNEEYLYGKVYKYLNNSFSSNVTDVYRKESADGDLIKTNWVIYDSQGRAVFSQAEGSIRTYRVSYLNDFERVVENEKGYEKTINFSLTNNKLLVSRIKGDSSWRCPGVDEQYTYDVNGYMASHLDSLGKMTKYFHNDLGLLDKKIEAFGTPNQLETTYTYDSQNRVTKIQSPTKKEIFTYDEYGKILNHASVSVNQ
jgi:hypothetical protein